MAKANQVAKNNAPTNFEVEYLNLKDLGYQQAKTGDTLEAQARYALSKIKGFPESVDDASKDQLYAGYKLRFAENNPAKEYVRVSGVYLEATPELSKEKERLTLSVDYAFSYTQQQFGKLKGDNNALYEIVKPMRDSVNKYCSNRLGELKNRAKKLTAPSRERSATKDFEHTLKDWWDSLTTRCNNAKSRGDNTADKERFARAKVAFMTEWNKG